MIDLFRKYGDVLDVAKAQHLFKQGESDGSLYVVNTGLLKAYYITRTGKEYIKSFIEPGEYIASIGAMLGIGACPFSVIALEEANLLRIPSEVILKLL